uniref:Uncharacterized protein n=1 Tax=Oryza meridionalis TaxID=40149 RepID=A0A0E0DPP1_9ORYZ
MATPSPPDLLRAAHPDLLTASEPRHAESSRIVVGLHSHKDLSVDLRMADLDKVGGGVAGQGARGALHWTEHMSPFMLRKMVELIAQCRNPSVQPSLQMAFKNNMIVLEEEHYMGHTKDKSKGVEFLNVPLENYTPMSIIFGGTQAT